MEKYLTGSAETGNKIIDNFTNFIYTPKKIDTSSENKVYFFNWHFNNQYGYVSIRLEKESNKIADSSLIDTDNKSEHKFDRPLGLYNDPSLYKIFKKMMSTHNITVKDVYSTFKFNKVMNKL